MKFLRLTTICLLICILLLPAAMAEIKLAGNVHHLDLSRPDSHAPISVMGDHVHHEGEWMLSYRYMFMRMQGSRLGDSDISNQRVLDEFMVVPTEMNMQMHMFGLMYAPSDKLTLMLMAPFLRKDMNHRNRAGVTFRTHSEGFGDLKLSGLVPIWSRHGQQIHVNAGMSFPTGSINEEADLPTGTGKRMPYPMQLGSGTFDLHPGVTYVGQNADWSWGAQVNAIVRLGHNRLGYSLGDQYEGSVWSAHEWSNNISQSIGFKYKTWKNVDGRDYSLAQGFVPTANTDSQGGKRVDFLTGFNWLFQEGPMKGHRFAVEAGIPIYQNLDGPQLETDWYMTAGWQLAFS